MPFTSLERRLQDTLGRPMKRPRGAEIDPWPGQKRRLLAGLRLISPPCQSDPVVALSTGLCRVE
jgi:hypothetical protein